MNELLGLLTFTFVGTVSPGPNNAVLWASGLAFGFRRTIPHVLGTSIGIGGLVVGVAAGIGALLEAVPAIELGLKVAGSVYLLVLAFLVVRSGSVRHASVAHPLKLWQAVAFQCLNPKAWVFVVAAVGTFLPPRIPWPVAVALLTGIIAVVAGLSSSIWAAGGAALGGIVENERRRRVVSVALAVLLVGSVALIWGLGGNERGPRQPHRSASGPSRYLRLWGFPGTPQAQAVALPTHTHKLPRVALRL